MGTAVRLQRRLPEWDAFVDIGYNSIIGYCIDPEMSLLFGDRAREERLDFPRNFAIDAIGRRSEATSLRSACPLPAPE
jgi:hypothetical protein